ncbi:hypothetical protein CONCODRAFT_14285 [Conidiobolus coronatus NRRL 28638]|uniref:Uncharacterized protein n=1 Tax=Conidiobolus coronatus (strain ATCC 28846 / CBS 209.66 / NRRL 28638) TaxID=796925 RepID=A0A137NPA3_CONC2|nr:hypothetical protein CONCODRAFT_14285 [Conidiobolus coronatus NRRL 28638]|eukprot:KXN64567.1 hypothetical protein CONCODRAFT_14285 [Conidiobolus coronatus NRRL 28638]
MFSVKSGKDKLNYLKISLNAINMILNGKARMKTYREVEEIGHDAFYKCCIAEETVSIIAELKGRMGLGDFSSHSSEFCGPVRIKYKGIDIYERPSNDQEIVASLTLGMIDEHQKSEKINRLESIEHNRV